jgi:hypothetical protein
MMTSQANSSSMAACVSWTEIECKSLLPSKDPSAELLAGVTGEAPSADLTRYPVLP